MIESIQNYQNTPYVFHTVPEIQTYLVHHAEAWDEDALYKASLVCEPRAKPTT